MARYCHYCGEILKTSNSSEIRKHLQVCVNKAQKIYVARIKAGCAGIDPYKEADNDRKSA
jgi:hypothetical protein